MIAAAAVWGGLPSGGMEESDDAATPRPFGRQTCPWCQGRADCPVCGGDGSFTLYRGDADGLPADIHGALEGFQLVELGILPVAGGWMDQAHLFVSACRVLAQEKADYDRAEMRKWQEKKNSR